MRNFFSFGVFVGFCLLFVGFCLLFVGFCLLFVGFFLLFVYAIYSVHVCVVGCKCLFFDLYVAVLLFFQNFLRCFVGYFVYAKKLQNSGYTLIFAIWIGLLIITNKTNHDKNMSYTVNFNSFNISKRSIHFMSK